MSEFLVLRLHAGQADRASWVIADSSGERASLPETGSVDEAIERAGERPVIVLVPGQEVLTTRVTLPVRGTSKMLQAVPFALEEQLADDVSTMHFALGLRHPDGSVTVSAVRQDLMEHWLARLDDAGLNVSRMLPETVGIPESDGISILVDGEQCFIRDPEGKTLVGDTDTVATYVTAMGFAGDSRPAELYISDTDGQSFAPAVSEIRLSLPDINVNEIRHGALPLMAATALLSDQPNLLQGPYLRSSGNDKIWQPWRTAAILGGVFLLTALGSKSFEVLRIKSELRDLNAEISQIASATLPGSRIVDPMLQLEQLASSLRGGSLSSDADFLEMLDTL
ncbi:MAG: hypothetical protein HKM98_08745, partial [Gammaproteobacteria bacterium]|nr:hypothetical protein [Gammaproteobacteria bacterium]